jgi:hypothetical protein
MIFGGVELTPSPNAIAYSHAREHLPSLTFITHFRCPTRYTPPNNGTEFVWSAAGPAREAKLPLEMMLRGVSHPPQRAYQSSIRGLS